MNEIQLILLLGIGFVLSIATLVGVVLQVNVPASAASGLVANLNVRIQSWWWIAFVVGCAVLAGRGAIIVLFAAISFVALREFLAVTELDASNRPAILAGFLIVLPLQYFLVSSGRVEWFVESFPLLILLVPALSALTGGTRNYLSRTAELLLGFVLCVYSISHVPALLMLNIPGNPSRCVLLMTFLILVSQASDVFQYTWGKLAGRHKVAPEISPSKTWEGTLGGIATATMLGACLWWMTPFSALEATVMSFLISIAGFLGGLVFSAIKRDRGVKDWSQFIPGHGGMLDRIDSLCISAPLCFYLTRLLFGG